MELMSRAVVKTRTMRPLPGEITPSMISNAILPAKIEAARRAITACTDLSELLGHKRTAEALAAAVRTAKDIGPEIIRDVNRMVADAWLTGGKLLSAYSKASKMNPARKGRFSGATGSTISERTEVARSLGVTREEAIAMVRIAAAPIEKVYKALQKSSSIYIVSRCQKATMSAAGRPTRSDSLSGILGEKAIGLNQAHASLRNISLDHFQHLTPDERKIVKAKITEIMELLDEMDRLCR